MRLTLLLAAAAFGAVLLGVTQVGEASTQVASGYRVTVSGSINYSWTVGWTERASGCTSTGNGSGSESIRFQSARPSTQLRAQVRGRRVWIQTGYMGGPVTGSIMREGDFMLSRSGARCSETRAAPKEGCGTVDFSGTTAPTGWFFFARGGRLIFSPGAIRTMAPKTLTCASSALPDAGLHGGCCQVDDRGAARSTDPSLQRGPRWSNKNTFRFTGRSTVQWPLRLFDPGMKAGTITIRYQWTATFTRVGR